MSTFLAFFELAYYSRYYSRLGQIPIGLLKISTGQMTFLSANQLCQSAALGLNNPILQPACDGYYLVTGIFTSPGSVEIKVTRDGN